MYVNDGKSLYSDQMFILFEVVLAPGSWKVIVLVFNVQFISVSVADEGFTCRINVTFCQYISI